MIDLIGRALGTMIMIALVLLSYALFGYVKEQRKLIMEYEKQTYHPDQSKDLVLRCSVAGQEWTCKSITVSKGCWLMTDEYVIDNQNKFKLEKEGDK